MNALATDLELTAEGGAPEWGHLIPSGRFTARDGRVFDNAAPEGIIEAFAQSAVDLPVDYQHQNDRPEATRSGPIPAAGWIKELAARTDGIWGRVEWTERARDMIARREYRYLSPVLKCRKNDRRILMLKGAGLVHSPALHLTELAEEEDTEDPAFVANVAEALGLASGAGRAEVMALLMQLRAVTARLAEPATPGSELASMDARSNPAEYVSVETLQEVLAERNEALARMRAHHVKAKVDDAFDRGYLSPAMRQWATELCTTDEASFDLFLAKSIPHFERIVRPQPSHAGSPPGVAHPAPETFPEVETAICAQLGLKPGALSG